MLKKYLEQLQDKPKAAKQLSSIWLEEKKLLNLSDDVEESITEAFNLLFNPFRRKSFLRRNVKWLPDLATLYNIDRHVVNFLKEKDLLITFREEERDYVTLTPEGIAIAILMEKYVYGLHDIINLDRIHIERIENILYDQYRISSLRNIRRLTQESKYERTLTKNQLSITLFLLVNGSIGKSRAFSIELKHVQEAAENIVRAFLTNSGENKKKVYPFNWYLTTAKKSLGDVFYNNYPLYYIYENKVERVRQRVKISVGKIADFRERWVRFIGEYEKQRPTLRSGKVCFFSKSETMELEKLLVR